MIACFEDPHEIGKVIHGVLSDKDGIYHKISFQILREATYEEYVAYCKKVGAITPWERLPFHYEILVD